MPKKSPMEGNQNAVKHGLYAKCRLPVKRMKGELKTLQRDALKLRERLEEAVVGRYGEINILRGSRIHSAVTHEFLARYWECWIRDYGTDSKPEQMALATDRISRERDRRDEAIDKLGLDEEETHDAKHGFVPVAPPLDVRPVVTPPAANYSPAQSTDHSDQRSQ